VIGIISAIAVVAVPATVFFMFIFPKLGSSQKETFSGSSQQKTAKQFEKTLLTQDEELARDCFDAAT